MEKKKLTRKEKFRKEPAVTAVKTSASHNSLIPGLIIALLGFVIYSNTLNHSFTLDDYSVILENRLTKQGFSAIPEIFKTSYRYGYYFTDDNLYRPVVKSMFAMEWGMAPENASVGHWINVLFYTLTGFVLFYALRNITGSLLFAFIASALFIAHPVHTEVVANIKSRDEILAFLFCILALERYVHAIKVKSNINFIWAALLFFIALMSKESAITFLAIFPLAGWFFTNVKGSEIAKSMLPVGIAAALFLLIRASVLQGITPDSVSVADNLLEGATDAVTKFSTAILILGLYLKILIFPHPLVFDYSYNQIPLTGPGDIKVILSFVIYTTMLVYAILNIRKKAWPAFFILFYLVTLSVSSNLFITIGSSMGERFLYTPSLGYCMAVAFFIVKLAPHDESASLMKRFSLNKLATGIFLTIGILYCVKTISRNPVWKDNYTLYSNDVHLSPNSTRTHYYLGNYLVKPEALEGKDEAGKKATLYEGISELKKSIEIYPRFADAFTQMGVAYYKLNKPDSAMICYQEALKLNPGYATIHNNIGTIYFTTGKYQDALKAFLRATELDPRYAEAYANAGSAYGMMQQYDAAIDYLLQAVRWDPNYAQAYYFIGLTYGFKGDEAKKNQYLEKAYSLDPSLRPK